MKCYGFLKCYKLQVSTKSDREEVFNLWSSRLVMVMVVVVWPAMCASCALAVKLRTKRDSVSNGKS